MQQLPLTPPAPEEISAAEKRLQAATDVLAEANDRYAAASKDRTQAKNALTAALNDWRELKRQVTVFAAHNIRAALQLVQQDDEGEVTP